MTDAILVVVDSPVGLDFGIDCMSFETGPNFRGVSNIPSGLHFVYHSTGMGNRQGWFFTSSKDEIIVKQWDSVNEEISINATLSEGSLHTLLQAIHTGMLNSNLGPYPLSQHHLWLNITGFISNSVLTQANIPPGTLVFPGDASDLNDGSELKSNSSSVTPYFPNIARVTRYSNIEEIELKLRYEPNKDLTSLHMDKSEVLERLVDGCHEGSWEDVLGELQLAFIVFILLFSYPALQFWKRIVSVICNSRRILVSSAHSSFSCAFLRILYEQLNFCPADFFENELSKDSFLKPAVSALFANMDQENLDTALQEHHRRLLTFMKKKFGLFESSNNNNSSNDCSSSSASLSQQRRSSLYTGEELYNLVDEDMPVVVAVIEDDECPLPASDGDTSSRYFTSTTHVASERDFLGQDFASRRTAMESALSINSGAQSMQEDEERSSALLGFSGQIAAAEAEDPRSTCTPDFPFSGEKKLSMNQIEISLYSWRYPALYDALCARPELQEDLAMAARRLLEEAEAGFRVSDVAVREATLFLSEEVPRRATIPASH